MRLVVYLALLVTGLIGYTAMMLMGFAHGASHHGGAAHGHGHEAGLGQGNAPGLGHAHGQSALHQADAPATVHHAPAAHAPGAGAHQHGAEPVHSASQPGMAALALLSPFNLFSLMIGGGLTGYVVATFASPIITAICAVVGALLLNYGVVRPLMAFFMRFASEPAKGLEGSVAQIALAEAAFDDHGRGVVTLTIDGQVSRLLARLPAEEINQKVKRGEELMILEVDPKRGTCVVTTQMRSLP